MLTNEELSLRRRFVKDFNLPINLVDSPYFEYYMERYDFFPKDEWYNCNQNITENFNGNINKWLQYYSQIRDNIITTIENSTAFKEFNDFDSKIWKIDKWFNSLRYDYMKVSDLNIYNNSNTGGVFVSIDLKKANFQALKYFNPSIVMGCENYDELIDYFGGDDYFKKSKYTRQVIFGKLNPKKTIQLEKYLINLILNNQDNKALKYLQDNSKLVTVKSDEIIFRITGNMIDEMNRQQLDMIKEEIKTNHNLDVSVNSFMLSRIVCENHNGVIVDGYCRYFYNENREDLKGVSSIFFPQIYAFSKGFELTDNDLYFRAEEQTAKFCNSLKFIGVE